MLPAILLIHSLLLIPIATPSSLPALTLTPPLPSLAPPSALESSNLTVSMNRVLCRRDLYLRPLSDFSTCIPSLFRMYAFPGIDDPVVWHPGDFRQWGPETDLGGCYILVDGGGELDVFSIKELLGPVIWTLSKCFLGQAEGTNMMGKIRVGPRNDWSLSVVLQTVERSRREGRVL